MVTASSVVYRLTPMHHDFELADRRINHLAARVAHWRPGAYASGLYADFCDAQAALAALDPVHLAYARERLERLAQRVGIVMPSLDDIAGSDRWRCVGVVKSLLDPWHLAKVIGLLFPQPSVQARVTMPGRRTVELWVAMSAMEGGAMLRRIDAVLTRPAISRAIGNCLVLSLRETS